VKSLKTITALVVLLTSINSSATKKTVATSDTLYQTDHLIITQVLKNAFQHTSFLQTKNYGLVPGNGLAVRNNNELAIFDTPADDKSAEELIRWVKNTLHCRIIAGTETPLHQTANRKQQYNVTYNAY